MRTTNLPAFVRFFPLLAAVALPLTVAGNAAASVSNPAYYFIDVPSNEDSVFVGPTNQFSLMAGHLEGDIDSSGNWTFGAAAFPVSSTGISIGGADVKAQLVVVASGTSGSFVYNAAHDIDITLHARIVLTGTGISAACQTGLFTATLSTTKTFTTNGSSLAGMSYNTSTGAFRANASDFTIGAITSGCDTAATRSVLNNALGFGTGNPGMKFDRGYVTRTDTTDPQLLIP